MLVWAAPVNLNHECANAHAGACKHGMQYDRRLDWHFEVGIWTWNIGSLSGKVEES